MGESLIPIPLNLIGACDFHSARWFWSIGCRCLLKKSMALNKLM